MRTNGAGDIPASHRNYDGHFRALYPCGSCGAKPPGLSYDRPFDEYEQVLAGEAGRIIEHAASEIRNGNAISSAGMLRDAARLLDLWEQRRRIREDGEEARRGKRRRSGKANARKVIPLRAVRA